MHPVVNDRRAAFYQLKRRWETDFMRRRTIAFVFVVGLLVCAWSLGAAAQNCTTTVSCAVYSMYSIGGGCIPTLPATAFGGVWDGPWEWQAQVKNAVCAPKPRCLTCEAAQAAAAAAAGRPIDLASGDTYITQVDVRVPGLGGGLTLARTWNSVFGSPGIFGTNWTSTYEEKMVIDSTDGYMEYARGDGGLWSFGFIGYDGSGDPQFTVAARGSESPTLSQMPTVWTLKFQNGEQRTFDRTSGLLLFITDRNGNTTTLGYDTSSRLVTVTDPASRHLYFSYGGASPYLVTSVTSDFGISLSYVYDGFGRLTQYTKPDNTTVSFQYNDPNPNLITSVMDANGKILESHTYNSCTQGLTSSRAGGVEAITIIYPLSCHLTSP